MNRRNFNRALAASAALAAVPYVRAQSPKLKIGVILPKSGYLSFIGQSCQKGADLAPGVIKDMLGVDVELMNADFESNVDTARTRAERLIQEGANVLVGPFDSGAAAAIAWPKVSFTCMNTAVRGTVLVAWNSSPISARPLRTMSPAVWKLRNTNL